MNDKTITEDSVVNDKIRMMILKPKYILGAIAFISFFSCTERTLEPRPDVEPVPIRLYTGIRTRAMVDAFGETPVGIAYCSRTGAYEGSWEGVATDNEIRLTPERYYPADGSTVYLRGFYPPADLSADGSLTYQLTGEEDLMLTGEQSGSLAAPFGTSEDQTLMYRHLMTQLNFTLTLEAENPETFRIRSLHLNGLANEVTLTLATESLTAAGQTASVEIFAVGEEEDGLPFVEGKISLPGYVLVQPSATFTLDLTLAVDDDRTHDLVYPGLPIRFEGGETGQGGISYTVKVELPTPTSPGPVKINATATVGEWQEGKPGSGDLVDGDSPQRTQSFKIKNNLCESE